MRGNSHLALDKFGHQCRQAMELILCPAIFDHDIAAIDETSFAEALTECRGQMDACIGGTVMEKPHHRHRWLLRPHCDRPRDCRAADERDELAALTRSPRRRAQVACIDG